MVPAKKRDDAYKFIEKRVREGDQVYIITPLIDLSESLQSVRAATEEFERLQKKVFSKLNLGLLHGRMKGKQKEEVMNSFREKKIDILVSTSVVEVGVDIANATIMVVESSERFVQLTSWVNHEHSTGQGISLAVCTKHLSEEITDALLLNTSGWSDHTHQVYAEHNVFGN